MYADIHTHKAKIVNRIILYLIYIRICNSESQYLGELRIVVVVDSTVHIRIIILYNRY